MWRDGARGRGFGAAEDSPRLSTLEIPEKVQGAASVAETWGGLDGASDKRLCGADGLDDRIPAGQAAGDRGGESSSGAMGAGALQQGSGEDLFVNARFVLPGQEVASFRKVASGDDGGVGSEFKEESCGGRLLGGGLNLDSGQGLGFVDVGSDHGGQGKKLIAKNLETGTVEEGGSGGRTEDGVEHNVWNGGAAKKLGDNAGDVRGSEHADADGRNVEILGQNR